MGRLFRTALLGVLGLASAVQGFVGPTVAVPRRAAHRHAVRMVEEGAAEEGAKRSVVSSIHEVLGQKDLGRVVFTVGTALGAGYAAPQAVQTVKCESSCSDMCALCCIPEVAARAMTHTWLSPC
jgi:hypothetical protein